MCVENVTMGSTPVRQDVEAVRLDLHAFDLAAGTSRQP